MSFKKVFSELKIWAVPVSFSMGLFAALFLFALIPHWYIALPVALFGWWVTTVLCCCFCYELQNYKKSLSALTLVLAVSIGLTGFCLIPNWSDFEFNGHPSLIAVAGSVVMGMVSFALGSGIVAFFGIMLSDLALRFLGRSAHREKNAVSAQQSKDKSTQKQPKLPSIQDEGMKFFTDKINEVLYGGIEWPTEFDKFIIEEPKNAEEYVKSQTAWIAKASAYIAMHLKRWIEEKVVDEIDYWYKTVSSPFTKRMMPIKQACEDLLNTLPARLPDFQQRFREKYEQMLSVAKKADEERIYRLGTDINDFKLAAKDLYEIVMMIHSEAFAELSHLKKKGIIWKILKIIGVIISAIITFLVALEALHSLGWLEPIKACINKILWHK